MESILFKIIVQTNETLKQYQSKNKVECKKKTEAEKKGWYSENPKYNNIIVLNVLNVNELNIFIKIEMVKKKKERWSYWIKNRKSTYKPLQQPHLNTNAPDIHIHSKPKEMVDGKRMKKHASCQ